MLAPANRGCQQHFRTWDAWRLVECHGENGDGGEGAEPGADMRSRSSETRPVHCWLLHRFAFGRLLPASS